MKLKKPPHKKYYFIIITLVVALGLAGTTYAIFGNNQSKENSERKIEQQQTEAEASPASPPNDEHKGETPIPPPTAPVDNHKTTDQVPIAPAMSVTITQLSQQNGMVTFAASVENGSEGLCSAVFSHPNGGPVTHEQPAANGVCGPTALPEVQFTALGEWKLTLRYYHNNTQAVAEKTINIQ